MESIVLELQREAMSSTSNISEMLRKSWVIARKLNVKDFEEWTNQELNGYMKNLDDIPEYRQVRGKVQFYNQLYGWKPVIIPDKEMSDKVTTQKVSQSITEIEYLLRGENKGLILQLPQEMQNMLSKWTTGIPTEFQIVFGKSQAQQILDTIRKIILDWTLKLEEDEILGEGISFSAKEKEEANKQSYTVNNFYGNASGVQIQQHTQHSTQTQIYEMDLKKVGSLISTLQQNISEIGLEGKSQKALQIEIENISSELKTKKPNTQIVKKSIQTIRNVLEGVTGSLIASGLIYEIDKIPM